MGYFTYVAWTEGGTCVYVGRATRKEVWRRFAEHKARKGAAWLSEASLICVYEHANHDSMRSHEAERWATFRPPHNARAPGGDGAPIIVIGQTNYRKDAFGRWHFTEGGA